jgi:hypothetical protein
MVDLKNYICLNPYRILEMHEWFNALCVPEWLLKYIPFNTPLENVWNSEVANELRESVSDGSFKYCDKTQCPYLEYLLKYGRVDIKGPIIHKSDLKEGFLDSPYPYRLDLDFDRSCNYKCPSCRKSVYSAEETKIKEIKDRLDEVVKVFGKGVKELYLSASGDPLVSQSYRTFLQTFNPSDFPMLESIHLHTNASMWNKKVWDSMPNIHRFVKSCEISIDASTKDTYENKVRLNGNWDNLIKNLKFISTIKGLKLIKPSFVVQQKNYKEMYDFAQLMKTIFGNKVLVLFVKINNWKTFTDEEFMKEKIWDSSHPEYNDFLFELNRIKGLSNVYHNMHDLLLSEKTIL